MSYKIFRLKNIEKILGPMYGKWKVGKDEYIYHKTIYDSKSLTKLLENLGFSDINYWDWREVFKNNPEYDDYSQAYYPHMDKKLKFLVS